MGDKPNKVVPISPINKDIGTRRIDPAVPKDGEAAPAPQGQPPFAKPAKVIDGKPQPPATPVRRRYPEPTD